MKLPWTKPHPILVVDDAADVRTMFGDILRFRGYEVLTAADGEAAMQLAESRVPRLILLDIMMPKVDGMSVLRFLKANPKTKDIPVIMLTALQQGKDVELAFTLGAAGYLIKPSTTERILAKIKEVLGG